jgi:hypothetical protein
MMKVKIYITLDIDPDEYPVPADENVGQEIQETLEEYFYEIDGANIRQIKTIME